MILIPETGRNREVPFSREDNKMDELTIYRNINGDTLELQVVGRVTTTNAAMLMQEVRKDFASVTNVLIDAKDMEYISSAGLRQIMQIITITESKNGKTMIKNVNENVKEVLEDTGFADMMEVIE